MSSFLSLLSYALMVAFAQNLIFVSGLATDRAIHTATRPDRILLSAGLIALFSLVGLGSGYCSRLLLEVVPFLAYFRLLPPVLGISVVYVLLWLVARLLPSEKRQLLKKCLPGCAFNSSIMLLGTLGSLYTVNFARMIWFSLGSGIGFLIAALLIACGIRRVGNEEMNREFLGLPSLLIYIGILSMAFVGVSGGAGLSL